MDDITGIDHYGCILTSTLCFSVAAFSFIVHFCLGLLYYYKTGTTPFREKIYQKVQQLNASRKERHVQEEELQKEEENHVPHQG